MSALVCADGNYSKIDHTLVFVLDAIRCSSLAHLPVNDVSYPPCRKTLTWSKLWNAGKGLKSQHCVQYHYPWWLPMMKNRKVCTAVHVMPSEMLHGAVQLHVMANCSALIWALAKQSTAMLYSTWLPMLYRCRRQQLCVTVCCWDSTAFFHEVKKRNQKPCVIFFKKESHKPCWLSPPCETHCCAVFAGTHFGIPNWNNEILCGNSGTDCSADRRIMLRELVRENSTYDSYDNIT